ncbi:MAG: hypothetical protein CME82_06425 [Halomonas sp.]|nr:hypothetical protein [Halomonas sp.]
MPYSSRLELVIDSRNGERSLSRIERKLERVDRQGQKSQRSLYNIGKAVRLASGAAVGLGAIGGAMGAMANYASNAAVEIERMAGLANTSVESFQRMTYAAGQHNIEQEKVSDILKDVNDRVGEFLQSGSGEMADFFDNIAPKIGVTAEQFRNLSGPQALQLYYDSLEKAGLNQQEMTFYMESMADEATSLIPLLRNGGEEFRRLGDEAQKSGRILSRLEIDRLKDIKSEFSDLGALLTTETSRAVSQFDNLMKSSLEGIAGGVEYLAQRFNVLMDTFRNADEMRSLVAINEQIAEIENRVNRGIGAGGGALGTGTLGAEIRAAAGQTEDDLAELIALRARREELMSEAGSDNRPVPEELVLPRLNSKERAEAERDLAKAERERIREEERLAQSQQTLLDRLYPLEAAHRLYREELDLLDLKAAADDTLNLADAQERLRTQYSVELTGGFMEQIATGGLTEKVKETDDLTRDLGLTFSSAFEDAIVGGEGFREVLAGIAEDIARLAVRKSITEPAVDWLGTALSLGARAFGGGSPIQGGFTSAIDTGASFIGQAHDGIDRVPREGTWLLDGGERVMTSPQADKLDRFLASQQSTRAATATTINIQAPITVQAQPGTSDRDAERQGRAAGKALEATMVQVIQNQMRPGGLLAKR